MIISCRAVWNKIISVSIIKLQIKNVKQQNRKFSNLSKCLDDNNKNNPENDKQQRRWRVLFFGTDEFALESLKCLHKEYKSKRLLDRLEAVTAYKGHHENAVINYSKNNNIKLHKWPLETHQITNFDIGLVVSFGHLIPSRIIQSFPLGMINVHASLLPKWRGAAPIVHSLMNGDSLTGVTIMKIMPKKFDVGEILSQEKVPINPDETQPELYQRLAKAGANLLVQGIEKLPGFIHSGKIQDDSEATYAPKIDRNLSVIRWSEMTAKQIYDLQRALMDIYPLTTGFRNEFVKIFGVKLYSGAPENFDNLQACPGAIVYDARIKLLLVKCGDGNWVSVEEISVPRHRRMKASDFNNGFIINEKKRHVYFESPGELAPTVLDKLRSV